MFGLGPRCRACAYPLPSSPPARRKTRGCAARAAAAPERWAGQGRVRDRSCFAWRQQASSPRTRQEGLPVLTKTRQPWNARAWHLPVLPCSSDPSPTCDRSESLNWEVLPPFPRLRCPARCATAPQRGNRQNRGQPSQANTGPKKQGRSFPFDRLRHRFHWPLMRNHVARLSFVSWELRWQAELLL